jgi:hypothetical protein
MEEREIVQMLQGKLTLSAADLIDCFEWPWSSVEAELESGFGDSAVAEWLEELLLDEAQVISQRGRGGVVIEAVKPRRGKRARQLFLPSLFHESVRICALKGCHPSTRIRSLTR